MILNHQFNTIKKDLIPLKIQIQVLTVAKQTNVYHKLTIQSQYNYKFDNEHQITSYPCT